MNDERRTERLNVLVCSSLSVPFIVRCVKAADVSERVASGESRYRYMGLYLAAIMEYLAAEVLKLDANAARDNEKTRVIPRPYQLLVERRRAALSLSDVTVARRFHFLWITYCSERPQSPFSGQRDKFCKVPESRSGRIPDGWLYR